MSLSGVSGSVIAAINIILFCIVVPVGWYLVRAVNASIRASTRLEATLGELKAVMLGLEGQGGVLRTLLEVEARVARLEAIHTDVESRLGVLEHDHGKTRKGVRRV